MPFISKTTERIFLGIGVLGLILNAALMLMYEPWGPKLGVGGWCTPLRLPFNAAWTLLVSTPFGLACLVYYARHPEWMAPRGRYVPGRTYPILSTSRLVAIGISAAFFVSLGLASPGASVDLPWGGVTFASVYFGAWESALGVGILGFILRSFVWGGSPACVLHAMWNDFLLCASLAVFNRAVLENPKYAPWLIEKHLRFPVYVVGHYLLYWLSWDTGTLIWFFPVPMIYVQLAWLISWWTFTGITTAAATYIVTLQLIRVTEARAKRAVTPTKT